MVVTCILGSVPFGVGLKGKEGHPFLEDSGVPSKYATPYLLCIYIYIYIYLYVHTIYCLMKVPGPKANILTVPPDGVQCIASARYRLGLG